MQENEYKIGGYIFSDEYDYKEAKKEEESVEYIKANTNLADLNKTIKLYNKLVERTTFRTIIGISFLKELRDRILKEKIVDEKNLPAIRIEKSGQSRTYSNAMAQESDKRHKELLNNLQTKLRNSRIINFFLILIIIAMMVITMLTKGGSYSNIENSIIDKYAAWEEELNAREKNLEQRESINNQD